MSEPVRKHCPDCGSVDVTGPDEDGWQYCNSCESDFAPGYRPGDDEEGAEK
jgi:uncharacterized Zn finger protein (UPF0148 family)